MSLTQRERETESERQTNIRTHTVHIGAPVWDHGTADHCSCPETQWHRMLLGRRSAPDRTPDRQTHTHRNKHIQYTHTYIHTYTYIHTHTYIHIHLTYHDNSCQSNECTVNCSSTWLLHSKAHTWWRTDFLLADVLAVSWLVKCSWEPRWRLILASNVRSVACPGRAHSSS